MAQLMDILLWLVLIFINYLILVLIPLPIKLVMEDAKKWCKIPTVARRTKRKKKEVIKKNGKTYDIFH